MNKGTSKVELGMTSIIDPVGRFPPPCRKVLKQGSGTCLGHRRCKPRELLLGRSRRGGWSFTLPLGRAFRGHRGREGTVGGWLMTPRKARNFTNCQTALTRHAQLELLSRWEMSPKTRRIHLPVRHVAACFALRHPLQQFQVTSPSLLPQPLRVVRRVLYCGLP